MTSVAGLFEGVGLDSALPVSPADCAEVVVSSVVPVVSSTFGADGAELVSLDCSAVEPTAGAVDGFPSFGADDSPDCGAIASDSLAFDTDGAVPPAGCGEEDVLAVDSKVSSLGVTGTELVSLGCSVVEPTAGAGDGFSDSSK